MKPGTQTAKAPRKTMEPVAIATGYSLVAGNADRSVLPNEYETRLHPAYIKQNYSEETVAVPEFDESYTNRYFSPYALTKANEDGERSVCILEPTGGPYTKLESQSL